MSLAGQNCSIYAARFTFAGWGAALAALCLLLSVSAGCGRGIGDACETSLRCSAGGTRLCDMTQPGGYCTLAACQPGNCPSEAVCVTFWQNSDEEGASAADRNRLSTNYCMRKCEERSDCRDDDGYDCIRGSEFGVQGEATVEGDTDQRFCAVRILP
jgi:hypothetical protein